MKPIKLIMLVALIGVGRAIIAMDDRVAARDGAAAADGAHDEMDKRAAVARYIDGDHEDFFAGLVVAQRNARNAFFRAIASGDTPMVQQMLSMSSTGALPLKLDVEMRDERGQTPVMIALQNRNWQSLAELCRRGARIRDISNMPAMVADSSDDSQRALKDVLNSNLNWTPRNYRANFAQEVAACASVVKFIFDLGAQPTPESLAWAVSYDCADLLRFILERNMFTPSWITNILTWALSGDSVSDHRIGCLPGPLSDRYPQRVLSLATVQALCDYGITPLSGPEDGRHLYSRLFDACKLESDATAWLIAQYGNGFMPKPEPKPKPASWLDTYCSLQ